MYYMVRRQVSGRLYMCRWAGWVIVCARVCVSVSVSVCVCGCVCPRVCACADVAIWRCWRCIPCACGVGCYCTSRLRQRQYAHLLCELQSYLSEKALPARVCANQARMGACERWFSIVQTTPHITSLLISMLPLP